jgi:hypothetical protein
MVVADRGDGGSTSYQMLETLRHYARERLDASGSADDTRRRHARHFAQLADALSVGLRGAEAYAWHTRVNADLDNFRAAVLWSLDSPEDDDAELAMRIIGNLWISADWGTSGIGAWAEQAVEHARSGNQRFVGVILSVAAANLFYRGEFSVGRALSAEALEASVEGSLFPGTPYQSAAVFSRPDELPVLLATGVEALQRAHASDWEIASLRVVVAAMAAIGGRHDLAEMEASAALGSGRRSNNPYMIALALYTHALCCYQTQPDTALAALDEYVAMAQMGASRNVLARSLALSSQIRASMGHAERALGDLQEAIEVAHRTGDRPSMAFTLARAVAVLRQDDPTAAAVLSGVVGTGALARQFAVLTWEREWFQGVLEEIKVLLGEERFEQAVAQGAALTYDDAVALASNAVEDQVAGVEGALGLGLRTQRHV